MFVALVLSLKSTTKERKRLNRIVTTNNMTSNEGNKSNVLKKSIITV